MKRLAQPGDIVVCLGAGNITQWAYALPGELAALGQGGVSEFRCRIATVVNEGLLALIIVATNERMRARDESRLARRSCWNSRPPSAIGLAE